MATELTRITAVEPSDRNHRDAKTLASRYRCEFVDLREVRIDHDLFHSVPVDLMFRYNFVPIAIAERARWISRWPIRAI